MTDFELVTQPVKQTSMKIQLLNDAYQVVEQMSGKLISLGITVSADSAIRRVVSASMTIDDTKALGVNYFGAWMNKMVRIQYGIDDRSTGETRWFLLGSFLFTESGYQIDIHNSALSINLADMMSAATQERGSQIGTEMQYVYGSSMSGALAATVARFSRYKRYDITEFEDTVPYDVDVPKGSYPYEAMDKLVSLYPWYEQYYSTDGVYTVRKIPTAMDEPMVMTAEQMKKIVISENSRVNYGEVKNVTEIWGKEITPGYTAKSCSLTNGAYTLTIHDTYEKYEDGSLIAFKPDKSNAGACKLRVQELNAYPIYTQAGDGTLSEMEAFFFVPERSYVVKYAGEKFILQGETIVHAMCMEYTKKPSEEKLQELKAFNDCENIMIIVNPGSAFACDVIGEARQVLYDGDYANIDTTQLAYERAAYENWKSTRIIETLTLETLFVPWLDVNQKVEYTLISTQETAQYLIQEISVNPISGTMTITLVRFRPLYPWLDFGVSSDWLIIGDDGDGTVLIGSKYTGAFSITDNNTGDVSVAFNLPITVTNDGNGNVTMTPQGE